MRVDYWCVFTSSSEKWQSNTRECFEACFVTSTTKFGADTISDWKQENRPCLYVVTFLILFSWLMVAYETITRSCSPLLLVSAVLLGQPLLQGWEGCCCWHWMWQWFWKERWTDQHGGAPAAVIRSAPVLLFSRNIPGEFSLCAVHLKLPTSRHLWKAFVFLELLLLFDFIRQKIAKCFVTCWKRSRKHLIKKAAWTLVTHWKLMYV